MNEQMRFRFKINTLFRQENDKIFPWHMIFFWAKCLLIMGTTTNVKTEMFPFKS